MLFHHTGGQPSHLHVISKSIWERTKLDVFSTPTLCGHIVRPGAQEARPVPGGEVTSPMEEPMLLKVK